MLDQLDCNYSRRDSEDGSVSRLSFSVQMVSTPEPEFDGIHPVHDLQQPHDIDIVIGSGIHPISQQQKPLEKHNTNQESLDTMVLRSFGEVVMFQSGDLELADLASKRSTVRQMVHSEPYRENDAQNPKTTKLQHCPFSTPILNLAATDSHGFVYLDDIDSGRSIVDTVPRYDDIDPFTKSLVAGYCRCGESGDVEIE